MTKQFDHDAFDLVQADVLSALPQATDANGISTNITVLAMSLGEYMGDNIPLDRLAEAIAIATTTARKAAVLKGMVNVTEGKRVGVKNGG